MVLQANPASIFRVGEAAVTRKIALSAGGGPFDLVMIDPPYRSGQGKQALATLAARGAISPGAWISLETALDEPGEVEGFAIEAERRHGKAKLTLLTLAQAG